MQQSAGLVRELAEGTKPRLLPHGHWHQVHQVRVPWHDTDVIEVAKVGTRKSWMVRDLPGLEITDELA